MTAGQIVTSPGGEQIVLGEIGQTVLLDNPRVRVWEVVLEPGEFQPWHLHHNPYLVLNVESSPCRMDWLNGDPPRYLEETVGGVVFRPTSPVHMLTNYGDRTYRNRLVELKDLGEEAVGDLPSSPVVGPALDLPVVFESPEVRVYGVDLAAGSGPVDRPDLVLITLSGGLGRLVELKYLGVR